MGSDGRSEDQGRLLSQSLAEKTLRDVLGLLAMPGMWVGKDGATVLQLTIEAVERTVPLVVAYFSVPWVPGQPVLRAFRLRGRTVDLPPQPEWLQMLEHLHAMPVGVSSEAVDSPAGKLQFVRLRLGYDFRGGSLWFGTQAEHPKLGSEDLAFLRAAASMAATGVQGAKAMFEREEAIRAKDEFLAMLGHELRNPLAPIVTSLALIKRRGNDVASREHAVIERQVRHLGRLVDDLLDVTRITRGKVELNLELIPVSKVLSGALEAVSPLMEQNRHTVSLIVEDEDIWVKGDATRLVQIFGNLLNNAAKYTPPGGRIVVRAAPSTDAEFEVTVQDNGTGISDELMPRVFNIFEQGASTIERSKGGLGIGLALVKSLVVLHGGSVSASSGGPGSGSTFVVRLPLRSAPAPTASAVAESSDVKQQVSTGLRVLLVDDNDDARESMQLLLESEGFFVKASGDPINALELASVEHPDLAVVDIGLPGMSGYDLAIELRRQATGRPLRLIALTGYGSPSDKKKSKAAGFEAHLVKPVNMDELIALIRSAASSSIPSA